MAERLQIEFPENHYNHPDFKTEWWYFAGIGEVEDLGSLNYHVCFFRKFSSTLGKTIYFAHFGTNFNGGSEFKEKIDDGGTSADSELKIFVGKWNLTRFMNRYIIKLDRGTSFVHIANKKPAIHGEGYYSISDMDVQGAFEGKAFHGKGWFDHEFSNRTGAELLSMKCHWFALQLETGIELMICLFPKDPVSFVGSMVFPTWNGPIQKISAGDYCLREEAAGWGLELPNYGMNFELRKTSELQSSNTLGAKYKEGTFDIVSRKKIGHGFFEIVEGGI